VSGFDRWVATRLDLQPERTGRLLLFLAISIVQYAACALARTASEALFLTNAGAAALPGYLIIVGLTVVPASTAMVRLIDRMPKLKLYRRSLLLSVVAAIGLRALVVTGAMSAWYAVLIGVVIVEMLIGIQFWVLLADYFTSLEQKRLVAVFTLAMAGGASFGGALANLLVRLVAPADLLLVFPLFLVVIYFLLVRLEKREQPYETSAGDADPSMPESLGSLPALVAEYPIVALMALVGFLDVLLGAMGSVVTYNVYAISFPDETRMTQFLGILKSVMNILQVVVVTFVTKPLVQRIGVGRMNVIYPLTTLASILGLATRPVLPVAVGASFNWDCVLPGVANPVENLTYNAVPPRFLGRVRSVSEGILQPTGLTVAGILLAVMVDRYSFQQIAWFAAGICVLHVVLGAYRGRKYGDALASQLKSRAIDLAAGGERAKIPAAYAEEVERLLTTREAESEAFGLELAARLGADRFFATVRPVLPKLEGRSRDAGVSFLTAIRGRAKREEVRRLLATGPPHVQALVLEAELRRRDVRLSLAELEPLVTSPDPKVRGLARAAALRFDASVTPLLLRDPELGDEGLAAVARGARAAADARLVPAMVEAMVRGAPGTRATALEGLVEVSPLAEKYASVVSLAELELESDDARVRAAAYALLGKQGRQYVANVASGLQDSHSRVRRRASEALAAAGEAALPHLREALVSPRGEVVDAALEALGAMRTADASSAALEFLAEDYRQVERNQQWRARIPVGDARWAALEVALDDSNQRVVDKVLRVLSAFGHARILLHARQALRGRDVRLRANAVEALASIPHRKFVLPVMGLLEALAVGGAGVERAVAEAESAAALAEMLEASERWIRIAALEVGRDLGRELPPTATDDADPLVRATVAPDEEGTPMSRLLFLRRVSLFQNLSLDDLLALDAALRRVDYLEGETIFEEGSVGDDFYLISEGEVSVRTGGASGGESVERARLSTGDFFGEMALFDDEPRSATCVAAKACTLLVLDRGRFYGLIEQLPQLGVAICKTLTQRLRRSERDLRAANSARSA
jgi:HEAT repeat protein